MSSPSFGPSDPSYSSSIGKPPSAPSLPQEMAAWLDRERAFNAARTLEEQRALAASIPLEMAVHPEVHPLQCSLLLRTWPLRSSPELPLWNHPHQPASSLLCWARLALLVEPDRAPNEAANHALPWGAVLEGLDLLTAPDPLLVIRALLATPDAPKSHALQALRGAVSRGFAPVAEVHALLLALLDSPDGSLRTAAFHELATPWASALPVPTPALLRGIDAEDEKESLAAVESAGMRGQLALFRLLQKGPPARRKAVVRWAGHLGDETTVGTLLEIARSDPAEMADAVILALVNLHHRGHFLREEHAADMLALLSGRLSVDVEAVAGLCFVARRAILEQLEGRDDDDPDWAFLVPVLAAWLRAPRPPASIFPQLLRVGSASRRPLVVVEVLRTLRALAIDIASAPRQAIERLALSRLRDYPEESLDLLDVVAGPAAREELLLRVGWEEQTGEEGLRRYMRRVFAILWHASSKAERQALLRHARPTWITEAIRASMTLALPDQVRELLRLRGGSDAIETWFVHFTEVATPDDRDDILLAMRRVLEKAVAQPWRLLSETPTTPWSDPKPGGENIWQLPERCVAAVEAMEARWRGGFTQPVCLLAPGKRLLPELLLALLDDAGPAALRAGVLRSLLEQEHPLIPAKAALALSHPDADVAKLGARHLARRGALWLSLELSRGASDRDERRMRACLEALTVKASTAGVRVAIERLSHRNMNIKKSAAEALGRIATADCAPILIQWLGQHDNPGFRTALKTALRRALGEGTLSGLLAAIQGAEGEERRMRLLLEALDGEISAAVVKRLSRRPAPWHLPLLRMLRSGTIHLAGGTLEEIAPELSAAGLPLMRPPEPPHERRDPFEDAVDTLFFEGITPDRAEAVLGRLPNSLAPRHVEKLRVFLGSWLDRMVEAGDTRPAVLIQAILKGGTTAELELIDRAAPGLLSLFEGCPVAETATYFSLLECLFHRLEPLSRLDLGQRLRRRLGDLPGLDGSPLGLLVRCGLVLRREDVERAFSGIRGVGGPAKVRRQILTDAFGVHGARLPEGASSIPPVEGSDDENWAEQLSRAVRASRPTALAKLRAAWVLEPEMTLKALAHELPQAAPVPEVLAAALDWMEALRPVGISAWSWPQREASSRSPARKIPELFDHRARLMRFGAWLSGEYTFPWSPEVAELERYTPEEIAPLLPRSKPALLLRVLDMNRRPEGAAHRLIQSSLLDRWEELTPEQAAALSQRVGDPKPQEDSLWATPEQHEKQRHAVERLLETPIEVPAASLAEATDGDVARWFEEARGPNEELARRALSKLAEEPNKEWRALSLELVEKGTPRVRHHVLRLIRKTLPQKDTLTAARSFLEDEDASVRRMAIRIVCHGRDTEAIPRVVERLLDPVAWVRREALDGLLLMAAEATPWVVRARDRARPDHARTYAQALSQLQKPGRPILP